MTPPFDNTKKLANWTPKTVVFTPRGKRPPKGAKVNGGAVRGPTVERYRA